MRTGARNTKIPGEQVPEYRGNEKRYDHGQAVHRVLVDQRFHGQQVDDTHGYSDASEEYAEEVPKPRPDHGNPGLQGICVDHSSHSVGCVMEPIYEFETASSKKTDDEEGRVAEVQIEHRDIIRAAI